MSYTNPPPIPVPPVEELRASAMRITAELDQAHFHRPPLMSRWLEKEPDLAVNDNVYRSDVECEFEVAEYDRVWMIRDGDCHIIDRKDYIRTEM